MGKSAHLNSRGAGLIDDKGIKKKAFAVLRGYCEEIESDSGKLD